MPPPVELFLSAVFKIGVLVHSIPDTTPGVDPAHSVAITGAIIELKLEGGWFY